MLKLPPSFNTKPHLEDPTGSMRVWLTDPPGMVDQILPGKVFTSEVASWLVGPATQEMLAHGRSVGIDRFYFVHDWRGVVSYESTARLRIVDWGRRLAGRIARIDIAISPEAPAFFRMAVSGGTMAMSVLGVPCFVNPDVEEAIENAGVRPLVR